MTRDDEPHLAIAFFDDTEDDDVIVSACKMFGGIVRAR